jgi:hypothetical protein
MTTSATTTSNYLHVTIWTSNGTTFYGRCDAWTRRIESTSGTLEHCLQWQSEQLERGSAGFSVPKE